MFGILFFMIYLFVLGRDPELTIMEIECVLEDIGIKFRILGNNESVAVVECSYLDPGIIKKFGGIVKIAKVISNTDDIHEIESNLENDGLYFGESNKIEYYIDHYNTKLLPLVEDFVKDYFKKIKLRALYKKISEPSKLAKKDILNKGLNLVVHRNYIGKVISITNPLEFKKRDIERPAVDYAKVISIRLAKILINLSKARSGETLLDPFAGSGTILQEALLNEINVIGTDNDNNSINEANKNLEWLADKYNIKTNFRIIKTDVKNLAEKLKEKSIDAVVTEPYMGPFIRKLPTMPEAKKLAGELSLLYSNLLANLNKVIKNGKRVVIVIPVFRTGENRKVFIDFQRILEECGFFSVYPPIKYGSSKNKLLRQIYVLEKLTK